MWGLAWSETLDKQTYIPHADNTNNSILYIESRLVLFASHQTILPIHLIPFLLLLLLLFFLLIPFIHSTLPCIHLTLRLCHIHILTRPRRRR